MEIIGFILCIILVLMVLFALVLVLEINWREAARTVWVSANGLGSEVWVALFAFIASIVVFFLYHHYPLK